LFSVLTKLINGWRQNWPVFLPAFYNNFCPFFLSLLSASFICIANRPVSYPLLTDMTVSTIILPFLS
jgi:hypothetical protein